MTKGQLRKIAVSRLKAQREEERRRRSEAIRRKLSRLAAFRRAKVVLCYVSLPGEVETWRLIERMLEAGKRVAVPVVRGQRLLLSEVRDPSTDLAPGSFGVWEPTRNTLRPVSAQALDLALVPGLAFDRSGNRLGRGRGYFDRWLARLPQTVHTIGLCFKFQLVDRLPTYPHDQPVHRVLCA